MIVDTNFLLSILGFMTTHQMTPRSAFWPWHRSRQQHSMSFRRAADYDRRDANSPGNHRDFLRDLHLTPAMAQAALRRMSGGITIRFLEHVRDGGAPNSAEEYFAPTQTTSSPSCAPTALKSSTRQWKLSHAPRCHRRCQRSVGMGAYKNAQGAEAQDEKGQVVRAVAARHHPLHFVNDQRPSHYESPLDAGHWVVTLDYRLLAFDRFKQRHSKGLVPVCLHPTVLTQLMQFWMPALRAGERRSRRHSNALMFHAFDPDAERVTVAILRALNRYDAVGQLPAPTVAAVVLNDTLESASARPAQPKRTLTS